MLKFAGCDGDANFTEMKVGVWISLRLDLGFTFSLQAPLCERLARAPYIQICKGGDYGLVGFEKALKEDEVEYIKENLKTVNSMAKRLFGSSLTERVVELPYEMTLSLSSLTEEEEKQFQIDRANFAAKSALSRTQMRKGNSRQGGRGGRGGRGGGRHGEGGRDNTRDAPRPIALSESQTGESASATLNQMVDLTWVYTGRACRQSRQQRRSRPTSHSIG